MKIFALILFIVIRGITNAGIIDDISGIFVKVGGSHIRCLYEAMGKLIGASV